MKRTQENKEIERKTSETILILDELFSKNKEGQRPDPAPTYTNITVDMFIVNWNKTFTLYLIENSNLISINRFVSIQRF